MKLLHIDSSVLGNGSVSRQLTASVVAQLRNSVPNLEVTYRDLAAEPLNHFSGSLLAARAVAEHERTPEQHSEVAASDAALEEFLAADTIVIGAPMYNFGIPSQLKVWFDHITVSGKTFKYTAEGLVGLAGGKRVIIASSRGGFYGADTPSAAMDFQESYLKAIFGFVGITDLEFVRAEGVAISPEHRREAIESAEKVIAKAA